MASNTFDIQHGMEVFGSDGEKIGNVDEVFGQSGGAMETGSQATSTADESSADNSDDERMGLANFLTVEGDTGRGAGETGHDVTRDPTELREEYGTSDVAGADSGDSGYFKVNEGGILGLGAKSLYIPFAAVDTVAADGVVTLSYSKDDVGNRFRDQPQGIDD